MKRRGRPPSPSEKIEVRVPVRLYDAVCREAIRARVPLAEFVRKLLIRQVRRRRKAKSFLSVNKSDEVKALAF